MNRDHAAYSKRSQHNVSAQYISQLHMPINISISAVWHGEGKYVDMRLFFPIWKENNTTDHKPILHRLFFLWEKNKTNHPKYLSKI